MLCAVTSSAALLGEEAAERGLEPEEGGDAHAWPALTAVAIWGAGARAGRGGVAGLRRAESTRIRWSRNESSWRIEQAVLVVHAGDLGEQALAARRWRAGALASAGARASASRRGRPRRRDAEPAPAALDQLVALAAPVRRACPSRPGSRRSRRARPRRPARGSRRSARARSRAGGAPTRSARRGGRGSRSACALVASSASVELVGEAEAAGAR